MREVIPVVAVSCWSYPAVRHKAERPECLCPGCQPSAGPWNREVAKDVAPVTQSCCRKQLITFTNVCPQKVASSCPLDLWANAQAIYGFSCSSDRMLCPPLRLSYLMSLGVF